MPHRPASAARVLRWEMGFQGGGALGSETDDTRVWPTGVDLDSENPRALLIEKVRVQWRPGGFAGNEIDGYIALFLQAATSTDKMDASQLKVLGQSTVALAGEDNATAGATGWLETNDWDVVEGSMVVAPWLRLALDVSSTVTALAETSAFVTIKSRVVPIPFDLQHAMYDLIDEAELAPVTGEPTRGNWWTP